MMQLAAELFTVEWQCQTGSLQVAGKVRQRHSGSDTQHWRELYKKLDILVGLSVHQDPFWANGHTKCGLYLHASSLVVSCW